MKFTQKIQILIFSLTFIMITPAFSRNARELVPAGHWVYDSITLISIETGTLNFSDNAPLTIAEIKKMLYEYDYDSLSSEAKHHYDKIEAYFDENIFAFKSGLFSAGIQAQINLEGFYKGNETLDWVYDRYKRQPLISLPVNIDIGDYLTMNTVINLQQNRSLMLHHDNYTNLIYGAEMFDINFPDNGYLSFGFDLPKDTSINFRIGMGEQSIGRSINGSIILSDYFSQSSWFNFSIAATDLKYNMNVTQFNVDKYMYTHSIDVRLFKKFHASASESILVYAPLELRFLNPLTIFHGMTPWLDYTGNEYNESNTCAYMCFKFAYTPVKYLRLYGLFAQDQFQTQYELDNYPQDVTPNGLGFQFGAESYIPLFNGNLHLCAEGYWADPYLYIKEDPAWSLVRTYRENMGDKTLFYEWVGSPFGPDTIAGEFNAGYDFNSKWSVDFNYLFKASGEYAGTNVFKNTKIKNPDGKTTVWGGHVTIPGSTGWAYPNKGEQGKEEAKRRQFLVSPSGIPEFLNRLALRGTYSIKDYLQVSAQAAFVFAYNRNNIEGNFQCGPEFAVSMKFDVTKLIWSLIYGM